MLSKSWLSNLLENQIFKSSDAQLAFKRGLVKNPSLMETIESRNKTSHTYKEKVAEEIFYDIIEKYYDAFEELRKALLKEKEERNL